jgi:hypothetical protein
VPLERQMVKPSIMFTHKAKKKDEHIS